MTVRELRQKYLEFFEARGHLRHPSGSLVPVDVTGRLDESLLFNGAGMVQFKPYFRGVAQPPAARLTNTQKCLRTGDIESVGDDSHLTFFEMLGNFSFGDYFKKDAIGLSWEFLTSAECLALPVRRLAFTVYVEDDESYGHWSGHLVSVGIDPVSRVFRLGEETNTWPAGSFSSGPPGPCGPNSEMFYWVPNDLPPPGSPYTAEDFQRDEAAGLWLEIWNDVFIQYEWQGDETATGGYIKTGMPALPLQSVDTGMGLERTVVALSGLSSVYETDVFLPLLAAIRSIEADCAETPERVRARRVIADHSRAAVFCIADGVLPSNTGRGYVLRRLIRRAVLKGHLTLGLNAPFLHHMVEPIVEALGDHYVEVSANSDLVVATLRSEEEQFRRTLGQGSDMLGAQIGALRDSGATVFPGEAAFRLYDTFGFPLEVTQELCRESGIEVELEGYKAALTGAQALSRSADARETVYGSVAIGLTIVTRDDAPTGKTRFVGYETTEATTSIVGVMASPSEDGSSAAEFGLALDTTTFYAESGGQVSDTGFITLEDGRALRVLDVIRQDGVFVHLVEPVEPPDHAGLPLADATAKLLDAFFGKRARAVVNHGRRAHIVRHHTATHLLHAALRQTLGPHVTQAGSLVSPEHLRFDFTHRAALTGDELAQVERTVNAEALRALPVITYGEVPIADARAMGAMALFGEKYADRVRVVQIGGMKPDEPSFSRELCGGIHVANTGEIGLVKILHEASAASGVRRIEAVAGVRAYEWALDQESTLRLAGDRLKTHPRELVAAIDRNLDALRDERRKREKLAQQGGGDSAPVPIGPFLWSTHRLDGADASDAKAVADRLADGSGARVALVANLEADKLTFVCKVNADAQTLGAKAGDIVRAVAQAAGGGGGGRADFATAGGRDPAKLDVALEAGESALRALAQ